MLAQNGSWDDEEYYFKIDEFRRSLNSEFEVEDRIVSFCAAVLVLKPL